MTIEEVTNADLSYEMMQRIKETFDKNEIIRILYLNKKRFLFVIWDDKGALLTYLNLECKESFVVRIDACDIDSTTKELTFYQKMSDEKLGNVLELGISKVCDAQ